MGKKWVNTPATASRPFPATPREHIHIKWHGIISAPPPFLPLKLIHVSNFSDNPTLTQKELHSQGRHTDDGNPNQSSHPFTRWANRGEDHWLYSFIRTKTRSMFWMNYPREIQLQICIILCVYGQRMWTQTLRRTRMSTRRVNNNKPEQTSASDGATAVSNQ